MKLTNNSIIRGTMAFIFNFRKVTSHEHINSNGTVYAKIINNKLSASSYSVVVLSMEEGMVVDQNVIIKGDYNLPNFVNMGRVDLMRWSEGDVFNGPGKRQLANGANYEKPELTGAVA